MSVCGWDQATLGRSREMSDEVDAVLKELYDHSRGGASVPVCNEYPLSATNRLRVCGSQSLRRMTPSAPRSSSKASSMTPKARRAYTLASRHVESRS
eukprot:COSAG02_NODE_4444_length_5348_cov_2.881120_3_plen_97_part_00